MANLEGTYFEIETSIPLALEPSGAAGDPQAHGSYVPLLMVARGYGDAADIALEDLLTLLYAPVKRYCRARLYDATDAGDVAADAAQETMIRVAKSLRTCTADTDRQVHNWALTIARRVIIDIYRSVPEGSATGHLAEEAFQGALFGISMSESVGRRHSLSDPMECLLHTVVDAYDDLSETTAELVWWRLIMGAEWIELGERFGTSATAARRRFQRAQEVMRREVLSRVRAYPPGLRHEVLALVGGVEPEAASDDDCHVDASDRSRTRAFLPVPPDGMTSLHAIPSRSVAA